MCCAECVGYMCSYDEKSQVYLSIDKVLLKCPNTFRGHYAIYGIDHNTFTELCSCWCGTVKLWPRVKSFAVPVLLDLFSLSGTIPFTIILLWVPRCLSTRCFRPQMMDGLRCAAALSDWRRLKMCNSLKFAHHCIGQSVRWERERERERDAQAGRQHENTLTSTPI